MIKNKFLILFVALLATTALWASNTITYTASEKLTHSSLNVGQTTFGPAITSHTFSNGTGTITCSGEITTIGQGAFYGCSDLTSIEIPNSVITIGNVAFVLCTGLTSVTIPDSVTTIELSAFTGCSSLTSVTIPNSVTTIGDYAFQGCYGLTSITIPNSVTTIGNRAFYGCKGLTSVTIPNSVTTIGDGAFEECRGLISVTIGKSVTTVGQGAFRGCTSLTSVTIPNSVTTIEMYAFSDCSSLTSVTIGNSVTTIGFRAFVNCFGLTSVTIPNSVTTIEEDAFLNVNNIVYNGTATGAPWGAKCVNGYIDGYFVYSDATKTKLCGCSSAATGEITIPNSVTTIGDYAFYWCDGLTSVTIPNSVTEIGEYAFSMCRSLSSVMIGNSVTTIGKGAFFGCPLKGVYITDLAAWCKINVISNSLSDAHNLYLNNELVTDLVIPNSVTSIGDAAFSGCSGLTSVTIPNSVTTIGDWAFDNCFGLTSVTIPNSVTAIGRSAFEDCSGLTSITIPNSITTIGERAFLYCSGLTSVTIPSSVTTIGEWAFYGCSGLTSITIPNSVTTIGGWAFKDCIGLTSITSEAINPPTCDGVCFYNVDKSIPLYVPAESVETYRDAEGWQDFTNILPITAEEVEVTEPETEPTNNSVVISWPSVADGETYTIEIRKGEELICTLVFNANGQLMSINFAAPARGGEHSSRYATATATGWTYTITGLEVGTEYTYTIVAKDNGGKVLYSETGSFKTTEIITSVENVDSQKSQIESQKFIRNGVLYIERNGKTYNVSGQKVK